MKTALIILFIFCFACCNAQRIDTIRSKPGAVVAIPVEKKKIEPRDSSYLRVTLFKVGYCISLFKDSLCTSDTTLIDSFISKRIDLIDKNKVLVVGDPNMSYNNFRPLKNIFKKHEFFRFKIELDPDLH